MPRCGGSCRRPFPFVAFNERWDGSGAACCFALMAQIADVKQAGDQMARRYCGRLLKKEGCKADYTVAEPCDRFSLSSSMSVR